MSVRAVWIVSFSGSSSVKILFSRTYPTVEKRCGQIEGDEYVPLPTYAAFADGLLKTTKSSVLLNAGQGEPVCSRADQRPVFELSTQWGTLWPLLITEQHGYLFCGLPLVEQGSSQRPPLVQIPGLTATFSLLLGMAEFMGNLPKGLPETSPRLADLYMYLDAAAPFGQPLDVCATTVKMDINAKNTTTQHAHKMPAWKPVQYKGKSQITVIIREQVRATQCESSEGESESQVELHGTVSCHADLEGVIPDMSLTLMLAGPLHTLAPLDHVIYHPAVQNTEMQGSFTKACSDMNPGGSCRVRLTPPLDVFPLCHYSCSAGKQPPILGCYQMKGEKVVEILCQLKLNADVRNSFERCEVHLPFYHRGSILNHECSVNHGSTAVSSSKNILIWDIGQKFPSKTLECLLKATLHFGKYAPTKLKTADEVFCVGQNAYAQIVFKMADYTHTRLTLDTKSIQVSSGAKFKLNSVCELMSSEYRIWNSHGESPNTFNPPDSLLEDIQMSQARREST